MLDMPDRPKKQPIDKYRHALWPEDRGAGFMKRILSDFGFITPMMSTGVVPADFFVMEYEVGNGSTMDALAALREPRDAMGRPRGGLYCGRVGRNNRNCSKARLTHLEDLRINLCLSTDNAADTGEKRASVDAETMSSLKDFVRALPAPPVLPPALAALLEDPSARIPKGLKNQRPLEVSLGGLYEVAVFLARCA